MTQKIKTADLPDFDMAEDEATEPQPQSFLTRASRPQLKR